MDHHGQRSSTERNALHEASVWGAGPEVVSLLLEYRADVNLKAKHNGKFKTAHAMAVSKGHEHIAQLIAKASCAPHVKTDLRQEGSTVTSASSAVGQVHRLQTAEPSHARSSSYLAGPMEKRARVDAVRPAVVQCTGCLRSITDVEANFCSKCGRALGVQAEHVEAQGSIAHLDSIGANQSLAKVFVNALITTRCGAVQAASESARGDFPDAGAFVGSTVALSTMQVLVTKAPCFLQWRRIAHTHQQWSVWSQVL